MSYLVCDTIPGRQRRWTLPPWLQCHVRLPADDASLARPSLRRCHTYFLEPKSHSRPRHIPDGYLVAPFTSASSGSLAWRCWRGEWAQSGRRGAGGGGAQPGNAVPGSATRCEFVCEETHELGRGEPGRDGEFSQPQVVVEGAGVGVQGGWTRCMQRRSQRAWA